MYHKIIHTKITQNQINVFHKAPLCLSIGRTVYGMMLLTYTSGIGNNNTSAWVTTFGQCSGPMGIQHREECWELLVLVVIPAKKSNNGK